MSTWLRVEFEQKQKEWLSIFSKQNFHVDGERSPEWTGEEWLWRRGHAPSPKAPPLQKQPLQTASAFFPTTLSAGTHAWLCTSCSF